MPRRPNDIPLYRRHKPTNQAVCTVRLVSGRRRDLYLGAWRSPVSKAEYARIVAIISANGGIFPSSADDLTVNEALVLYTRHITACYVEPDGSPSRSVENMYVATAPADLRRSFDGLMGLVRDFLGGDPLSGHLFVFRNRIGDRLKVLWWDRDGLAIF